MRDKNSHYLMKRFWDMHYQASGKIIRQESLSGAKLVLGRRAQQKCVEWNYPLRETIRAPRVRTNYFAQRSKARNPSDKVRLSRLREASWKEKREKESGPERQVGLIHHWCKQRLHVFHAPYNSKISSWKKIRIKWEYVIIICRAQFI